MTFTVHQFENMIINVFGMHFDFIVLHVSTIMEVTLLGLQIKPCLKCQSVVTDHNTCALHRIQPLLSFPWGELQDK